MTNAETPLDPSQYANAAELNREIGVTGPMPFREPGRAQKVAAIHAYADFLAEHPDVPAPQYITAHAHYRREDEPDTEMRIALVKNWADRQGIDMERLPTCVYADLVIASPLMHGLKITHTVLTVSAPERAL